MCSGRKKKLWSKDPPPSLCGGWQAYPVGIYGNPNLNPLWINKHRDWGQAQTRGIFQEEEGKTQSLQHWHHSDRARGPKRIGSHWHPSLQELQMKEQMGGEEDRQGTVRAAATNQTVQVREWVEKEEERELPPPDLPATAGEQVLQAIRQGRRSSRGCCCRRHWRTGAVSTIYTGTNLSKSCLVKHHLHSRKKIRFSNR